MISTDRFWEPSLEDWEVFDQQLEESGRVASAVFVFHGQGFTVMGYLFLASGYHKVSGLNGMREIYMIEKFSGTKKLFTFTSRPT